MRRQFEESNTVLTTQKAFKVSFLSDVSVNMRQEISAENLTLMLNGSLL